MANVESILLDCGADGVAVVTLNRPEQLNALDRRSARELAEILDKVDRDSAVRAVILTGAGRAFCAGAKLDEGPDAFKPLRESDDQRSSRSGRDWGGELALRIFDMTKPMIAAINGAAVGIGATLSLPCDIRLASTQARFGFVFTRRGIVPDACSTWFLPRVVGISTALRWCYSGELISAHDALNAGLVSSVCEGDALISSALTIARQIVSQTSALAVSLTRRLLWQGLVEDHPMGSHRWESELLAVTSISNDAREGVESFLEKRPATFTSLVPTDLPPEWPLWQEPEF